MLLISTAICNVYGICLSLGVLVDCCLIGFLLYKLGVEYYKFLPLSLLNFIVTLLGGKILGALQKGSSVLTAPLSSMGGLIASLSVTLLVGLLLKIDFSKIFTAVTLPLPITYAITKLGCAYAGCCSGIPWHGSLSINNTHYIGRTFPVQITESIVFFVIFCVFTFLYIKGKFNVKTGLLLIMTCCIAKGSLYYLRYESIDHPFGSHQIIILSVLLLSLLGYVICSIKHKNKLSVNDAS